MEVDVIAGEQAAGIGCRMDPRRTVGWLRNVHSYCKRHPRSRRLSTVVRRHSVADGSEAGAMPVSYFSTDAFLRFFPFLGC
jgi:hypothetical protein